MAVWYNVIRSNAIGKSTSQLSQREMTQQSLCRELTELRSQPGQLTFYLIP
jgi:hypothetical protein